MWETIVSGKEWRGEFHNKRKNGELYWEFASISPIINDKGIITHYLAVKEDITKRKIADKSLKDSESRLSAFSEVIKEVIFFSDKGLCIEANKSAQKVFGYSYNEILGKFGTDFIAPESRELVKNNMLSGYDKPYDALAIKKDGSKFWCEVSGRNFNYQAKDIRVTSMTDITERKKAEEKIRHGSNSVNTFLLIGDFIKHFCPV
jgi:PAS domain S-box-containing protein